MGSNTGASVVAAKPKIGGGLWIAPLGSVLPTDASTALDAAFKALGPISKDGIQPSRDTSVQKIEEWDGTTLAQLLDDDSRSFEIKLYGIFDEEVQKFVNGPDNVTVTPDAGDGISGRKIAVLDAGGKPDQCCLCLEMRYGLRKMRKILPVADPTITGEEPYQGSALMGYTTSVEALKDESGFRVYEYYEDAPLPVSGG